MTRLRVWLATPSLADRVAVAFGVVLVGLVVLAGDDRAGDGSARSLDALGVVIPAAAVALLAARKRVPALTALAVVGLSILWYSLDYTSRLIDAPTLAAFFTSRTTGDRMREVGVGEVTLVRRARPDVAHGHRHAPAIPDQGRRSRRPL